MAQHQRNALEDCRAYLVGQTDAQLVTLERLASRTGFLRTGVMPAREADFDRTRLAYFLFHCNAADDDVRASLKLLRELEGDRRFSPAIMVAHNCRVSDASRFIGLGFDDIILLPQPEARLRERLASQLHQDKLYVETSSYFGPDRRRGLARSPEDRRGTGTHRHVRYVVRRSPRGGNQVVGRDVVVTSIEMPHQSWVPVPRSQGAPGHQATAVR